MKQYFNVSAKIQREDDKGKVKTYTERYLVEAVSVTDAETKAYKYLEDLGEHTFSIASASVSKVIDVI